MCMRACMHRTNPVFPFELCIELNLLEILNMNLIAEKGLNIKFF